MHIIIPMSGIGKRFIDAGYTDPKPLIVIDGKTIIEHVCDLFPNEMKFTFICNQDHLATTKMREILLRIKPTANIVAIPNHKQGPVFAVLQMADLIDDEEEVIVNYCDFGTYWDYAYFLRHTRNRNADGAIPAYRGFHPHMLGTTNYAFMREDKQWMLEIKEKSPFTDNRMQEYASNGTYYFKHGKYVKKYFQQLMTQDINLNGEYYVSLIYNLLVADNLKVSIYEIQHMLQWGTPGDVEEYQRWSQYFRAILNFTPPKKANVDIDLIPLAGRGSRFAQVGYELPKPLLPISGKPMIIQATDSLPKAHDYRFVILAEHQQKYPLTNILQKTYPNSEVMAINEVTRGQAITCNLGLGGVNDKSSLLIAATDNSMLYNQEKFQSLINEPSLDAIIFTFRNHPSSKLNPQMYGWVMVDENNIATGVSVKKAISEHPENDHAIVGTFYFRTVELYRLGLKQLIDNNVLVNNEFYVDSLLGELIKLGYKVKVFEVDAYICFGTPNDYQTFNYWQSFFHKVTWHPYYLSSDPTMWKSAIDTLDQHYHNFKQEYI